MNSFPLLFFKGILRDDHLLSRLSSPVKSSPSPAPVNGPCMLGHYCFICVVGGGSACGYVACLMGNNCTKDVWILNASSVLSSRPDRLQLGWWNSMTAFLPFCLVKIVLSDGLLGSLFGRAVVWLAEPLWWELLWAEKELSLGFEVLWTVLEGEGAESCPANQNGTEGMFASALLDPKSRHISVQWNLCRHSQ